MNPEDVRPAYYVPALPGRMWIGEVDEAHTVPLAPLEAEQYRLHSRHRHPTQDADIVEYRWVNPAEPLRAKIRELDRRLAEQERVADAIHTLGRIFNGR